MSFDSWKTHDPADDRLGRTTGTPPKFCCKECSWRGEGYFARNQHWMKTGHVTVDAEAYDAYVRDWPLSETYLRG